MFSTVIFMILIILSWSVAAFPIVTDEKYGKYCTPVSLFLFVIAFCIIL